jgi:hypothetical protein
MLAPALCGTFAAHLSNEDLQRHSGASGSKLIWQKKIPSRVVALSGRAAGGTTASRGGPLLQHVLLFKRRHAELLREAFDTEHFDLNQCGRGSQWFKWWEK